MGREVHVEPTYIHPQYALVQALHAAVAIAGSVLAAVEPAIGFALVLVAATLHLPGPEHPLLPGALAVLPPRVAERRLARAPARRTAAPGPGRPLRRSPLGYVFGERGLRLARRLSRRGRVLLGPWRLIFWAGMAPLLAILGARMAGFEPGWLSILQLFPTVLLVLAVFLLLDIALSGTVPGAYDNASGVAAVLSAAQRLETESPHNLDVWVVLSGAEESAQRRHALVRPRQPALERERTVFVNVDSVSYGEVHYETSEGPVISTRLDAATVELCEALSAADPANRARPMRSPLSTDLLPSRSGAGARSIPGARRRPPPPWYHFRGRHPDRVVGER